MKYIAYEGTYNEQYYDTKTKVISWKNTESVIQCNRAFRPDLRSIGISGKKTWLKIIIKSQSCQNQ